MRIKELKYRTYTTDSWRPEVPIFLFCYHKTGTVLLSKIFSSIAKRLELNFAQVYGYCDTLDHDYDIVLFSHSLASFDVLNRAYKGLHIIRDPREILISGYLYHLRTKEAWCNVVATDYEEGALEFPLIPTFLESVAYDEQIRYLQQFHGTSYQKHLQALGRSEGIMFELNNYSGWTLDCMSAWNYDNPKVMEIKLESVMENFDTLFEQVFRWFGFSKNALDACMQLAQKEDISRMNNTKRQASNHISKEGFLKWKKYLIGYSRETFDKKYGYLVKDLGYAADDR